MITLLFLILLASVFGRLTIFGIKAAWGLGKFLFVVVFWPLLLIGMLIAGLVSFAFPILIIIGLLVLIGAMTNKRIY